MELKVALPGDKSYSWYENAYDARAYKRLCTEFGVSPDTDWRAAPAGTDHKGPPSGRVTYASNNTRLVAATKKKKTALIAAGVGVVALWLSSR